MSSDSKASLHPRNRHTGRYDFPKLIAASPELGKFTITNPHGKPSIDFANPDAVKVFNRALLKLWYGITHWDIPPGYLCPPIPGRADYIHCLADLLASDNQDTIPRGAGVRALDIGTGANCIYPLIGQGEYRWHFTGSDIDAGAIGSARAIVEANGLGKRIALRRQHTAGQIFTGVIQADERFDVTLCNPPFHTSFAEATAGSKRKWRNLGKTDPSRKLPVLNFGGQAAELWCEGGELRFVIGMVRESAQFASQVLWFTSLVSKGGNLPGIEAAIAKAGAVEVKVVAMGQGQKQSRLVAWTWHDVEARRVWALERWKG